MGKTSEVELTDRERAVIWAVMAWFNKNNVGTSRLMEKLYFDEAPLIAKKYDERIENRVLEVAEFLVKHKERLSNET